MGITNNNHGFAIHQMPSYEWALLRDHVLGKEWYGMYLHSSSSLLLVDHNSGYIAGVSIDRQAPQTRWEFVRWAFKDETISFTGSADRPADAVVSATTELELLIQKNQDFEAIPDGIPYIAMLDKSPVQCVNVSPVPGGNNNWSSIRHMRTCWNDCPGRSSGNGLASRAKGRWHFVRILKKHEVHQGLHPFMAQ